VVTAGAPLLARAATPDELQRRDVVDGGLPAVVGHPAHDVADHLVGVELDLLHVQLRAAAGDVVPVPGVAGDRAELVDAPHLRREHGGVQALLVEPAVQVVAADSHRLYGALAVDVLDRATEGEPQQGAHGFCRLVGGIDLSDAHDLPGLPSGPP
jgi:hypothetical protein